MRKNFHEKQRRMEQIRTRSTGPTPKPRARSRAERRADKQRRCEAAAAHKAALAAPAPEAPKRELVDCPIFPGAITDDLGRDFTVREATPEEIRTVPRRRVTSSLLMGLLAVGALAPEPPAAPQFPHLKK